MPRPLTEQERQVFLAEPRIGVLSVASGSERPPLTVPIWYSYQPGGPITFFTGTMGRQARKTRLIQEAGIVSLCVQKPEPPYKYATVEGTLIRTDQPPSAEQMLAVTRRYLPEEQAQGFVNMALQDPGETLILFTVRPDRWLTFDFSDDAA